MTAPKPGHRSCSLPRVSAARALACLALAFCAAFLPARGEPVTTILGGGDPLRRVDVAILGDGYTAAELGKYAADVNSAVNGFFAQQPFAEYVSYFNVHRVDVISAESGVDHPERDPPVYRSTAFDATYNCSGIQRLICVNTSKVDVVLGNSLAPDQRDIVLVIVNDPEYGGSGGAVAVASTNPSVVELVLHELGHSFGYLADEYSNNPPTCNNTYEPPEPNVTRQTDRTLIKWNTGGGPPKGWIHPATPIPTTSTVGGLPGLYQGAKYCTSGLYRPTYLSKMRGLFNAFEPINEEQLVKRIYNFASPLDASLPMESELTMTQGEIQTFEAAVMRPATHPLTIAWWLDGQPVEAAALYALDTSPLAQGVHDVELVVHDPTSKVRHDPEQALTERSAWRVEILESPGAGAVPHHETALGPPLTATLSAGGELSLEWSRSCAGGDTDYAVYEGALGDFGSHAPRFCSTGGATRITFAPGPSGAYYVVVPRNAAREGSYGAESDGSQRPPSASACLPQALASCP